MDYMTWSTLIPCCLRTNTDEVEESGIREENMRTAPKVMQIIDTWDEDRKESQGADEIRFSRCAQ